MIRIYCETNAIREYLKEVERDGRIELRHFAYDTGGGSRKLRNLATPSGPCPEQIAVKPEDLDCAPREFGSSNRFDDIERIVGKSNVEDVLHIDSAAKDGCKAFFTCDKNDILSNRDELQELLGIRFFHPDEKCDFLAFLDSIETPPSNLSS